MGEQKFNRGFCFLHLNFLRPVLQVIRCALDVESVTSATFSVYSNGKHVFVTMG